MKILLVLGLLACALCLALLRMLKRGYRQRHQQRPPPSYVDSMGIERYRVPAPPKLMSALDLAIVILLGITIGLFLIAVGFLFLSILRD
ncbi:MAG TPA: hypothetical protein VFF64_02960 [Candidatus Eremiobacteraceae bacterium]|nr:hypothetical protein [Candidatus Eremiobacteraceae bacterium]